MNPEYEILTTQDIIELHDKLIDDFGGLKGTYPETGSKVDAILGNVYGNYFGQELYPSLFDKAAMLLYSLCKNHCFPDGNKRIAFNSCEILLAINGFMLDTSKMDFAKFVENIAESQFTGNKVNEYVKYLTSIIYEHSYKFEY